MIAQIDIPLVDAHLSHQHLSHYSAEDIRTASGESVRFQQKREHRYIDEREKNDVLSGLIDSFIKRTATYLSHPDFPGKCVLKEYNANLKRKAWEQNDTKQPVQVSQRPGQSH